MNYRPQIQAVRGQFLRGEITLDEAKEKIQPWLDDMNASGVKIAIQHKFVFKPITFAKVFR